MKTIVIYATKYGAAGEVAKRIAGMMNGAVACDLKLGGVPSLADFDSIIIGSSLYAGMIRKEAKVFVSKNAGVLREKKLGLFLCGLDASEEKTFFETNFSADILQAAKAKGFFGGIFDPKKANALERFIIKIVSKRTKYANTIDDSKIEQFVERMKA